MRLLRPIIAITVLALAPLGNAPVAAQQTTEAIAKLEAKRDKSPNNAGTLRSLGIAYFKNKEYGKAQVVLAQAAKLNPKDGVTALYLGMSAEEQGDLVAARAAYTTYLARGRTKSAKDEVNKKLAALAHRELQARAKATVAAEQQIGTAGGPANAIAVLPLSMGAGSDPQYEPLGRGLADLMISDFGKIKGITLLERDRMQAILDEIRLGESGTVDNATAVRSGRLVQAGRIVTGSLTATPQNASMTSAALNVSDGTIAGTAATQTGPLEQLFELEKSLVISVARAMNVGTTQEFAAITGNRPTRNLQAFLAYSRGLVAKDQGRLDDAARFFETASTLDPGFAAAAIQASAAQAGQAGASVTTAQIDSRVTGGGAEAQVVAAAERGGIPPAVTNDIGNTLGRALSDVNPSTADLVGTVSTIISGRDPSTSTTETDQLARTGVVKIIIRRP